MSDQTIRLLNVKGLLFSEGENGSVSIEIPSYDIDCPGALVEFTADEWASILGFVSKHEDKKSAYWMALKFHEGAE